MSTPLILTLNEHGIPTHWSTWQDICRHKCLDNVVWEMGDHHWIKTGGYSRQTGEQTRVQVSSIVAIRGDYCPKYSTPLLSNTNLFRRDLNICCYCGNRYSTSMLTNDHILPKSRGGAHSWTNCVTSCRRCNNYKDNKLPHECGLEMLYTPYVPSREETLILRNRYILGDQMEFLRSALPKHSRYH